MRSLVAVIVLVAVTVVTAPAIAQSQFNGTIWQVTNDVYPSFVSLSVSGATFVAAVVSFEDSGGPYWLAIVGTMAGSSGTGTFVDTGDFQLHPTAATVSFTLTGTTGSFTTAGAQGLLRVTSGSLRRVFP